MNRLGAAAVGIWLLFGQGALADDRSYLTALLEDNLSGDTRKVVIAGFSGALSSQAKIDKLTVADDAGVWLTLSDVVLDWNRAALFSGNLSVNTLTAGRIELVRIPATTATNLPALEAFAFSLPDLPVSIDINTIEAAEIDLGPAVLGQAVTGHFTGSMSLAGGEGRADLTLERTDDGPAGKLDLAIGYDNATGQLDVVLGAKEDAGGIAVTLLGVPGAPQALLSIMGNGPVSDFSAQINLETEGVSRLTGAVTLRSDNDGNNGFRADLTGDLAPLFLPAYASFFGDKISMVAEGSRDKAGRIDLSQLDLMSQALALHGQLTIAPDGVPEKFDLTGRLGLESGEQVLLPLTTALETRVTSADLRIAYDATAGEEWVAKASLNGMNRQDFKADLFELDGAGKITRSDVGAMITGSFNFAATGLAPADEGLAQALGTEVSGKAEASWSAEASELSFSKLSIAGQDYRILTSGQIGGLETGLTTNGRTQAEIANLSRFSRLTGFDLGGSARIDVTGTGSPLSGQFDVVGSISGGDLQTGITQLDGLLNGASEMQVSVKRNEAGTVLRSLDISAGPLTASAQGTIASTGSDLQAALTFTDISVLGTGYGGALTGDATFKGNLGDAQITLDASGTSLSIGQSQVDHLLTGVTALTLAAHLTPSGAELQTATLHNERFDLRASGSVGEQSAVSAELAITDLAALGDGYRGALAGTAQLTGSMVQGNLTIDGVGHNLGIGQFQTDTLLRGDSKVTADLALTANGVRIHEFNLSNPQIFAKATGQANGTSGSLDLTARIANLGLLIPEFPGPLMLAGTAKQDANGTELDLRGQGPGRIEARVSGRIASDYRAANLTMTGTAQAALGNAFIAPRAMSGDVGFDLALRGPIALSSVSGTARITNGRVADPSQNFALQAVTGTAVLSGGLAQVEGDAEVSSGGRLLAKGSIGLNAPYPADLDVTVSRVTLRDPALYETLANGNVRVTGPVLGGATISGRIALIETELRIPSTGLGGTGDIPDLQHVHEGRESFDTRVRAGLTDATRTSVHGSGGYKLDLQLSAPNRVFVRGRGLDAELGGTLMLLGSTQAIIPGGSFGLIRGRLDILGKRLDLTEASLQLQGALVPVVYISASTSSDGYVSSVVIEGNAFEPQLHVTSVPDLPEEEALARLLFGQGLQNISAFQAAQLASAVATLAGRGGDGIIGKVRKSTGLDNLDLRTNEDGTAEITAGKYLRKQVYAEVSVDQDGKSQINLNLDVAPHITLRGRADSDGTTGLGIFLHKDY